MVRKNINEIIFKKRKTPQALKAFSNFGFKAAINTQLLVKEIRQGQQTKPDVTKRRITKKQKDEAIRNILLREIFKQDPIIKKIPTNKKNKKSMQQESIFKSIYGNL